MPQRETSTTSQKSNKLPILLQGVVESLIDGIMILTQQGELLHANSCARRICRQLAQAPSHPAPVPEQIWHICQVLIEHQNVSMDQPIIIEDEIKDNHAIAIRIRVRWLELGHTDCPHLLITLEDQCQSARYRAIAEARKYGLTDRETQVWQLKRAGYTYKAIGAELHIAEDTVKKHIKSIYARRDAAEWAQG